TPLFVWGGLAVALFVGVAAFSGYQGSQRSVGGVVQLSATVEPRRVIVVDGRSHILQIVSNTAQYVEPSVRIGSESGPQTDFSGAVLIEYQLLQDQVDFSKTGIVYQDREPSLWASLSSLVGSVGDWLVSLF